MPPSHSPGFPRRQLLLEPITLSTKAVYLGVHSGQEEFGRGRGDPGPLKLEDFFPLALHLDAHAFDFGSDMVEVWHFTTQEL
jgi:hypothetical protein